MAKAVKKNMRSDDEKAAIVSDIKEKAKSKVASISQGCESHGINVSQYYSWEKKFKKPRVKKEKAIQITEIARLPSGKTLLVITDDQSTIANIISTFNRS